MAPPNGGHHGRWDGQSPNLEEEPHHIWYGVPHMPGTAMQPTAVPNPIDVEFTGSLFDSGTDLSVQHSSATESSHDFDCLEPDYTDLLPIPPNQNAYYLGHIDENESSLEAAKDAVKLASAQPWHPGSRDIPNASSLGHNFGARGTSLNIPQSIDDDSSYHASRLPLHNSNVDFNNDSRSMGTYDHSECLMTAETHSHRSTSHAGMSESADTHPSVSHLGPGDAQSKPDGTAICSVCGAQFTGRYRRGNCARHFRQVHNIGKSAESHRKCICRVCKKPFKRQDARRKHEWRKHHLEAAKPHNRRESSTRNPETIFEGVDDDRSDQATSICVSTLLEEPLSFAHGNSAMDQFDRNQPDQTQWFFDNSHDHSQQQHGQMDTLLSMDVSDQYPFTSNDTPMLQAPITGSADFIMPKGQFTMPSSTARLTRSEHGTQVSSQDFYTQSSMSKLSPFCESSQTSYDAINLVATSPQGRFHNPMDPPSPCVPDKNYVAFDNFVDVVNYQQPRRASFMELISTQQTPQWQTSLPYRISPDTDVDQH